MTSIQDVLSRGWTPAHEGDFVINIFTWRDYVILVTYSGRIWRAEDKYGEIYFTLIGHLI